MWSGKHFREPFFSPTDAIATGTGMQLLSFLTSINQRDVKTRQLSPGFCVCECEWLFSDRADLATQVALSRVHLRQDGVKHQTSKPRNSVFHSLHLWPGEVRKNRALVPAAKALWCVFIGRTPGQSGWRFHHFSQPMEKDVSKAWYNLHTHLENFNHMPFSSQGGLRNSNSSVRIRLLKLITKALYPLE